MSCKGVAVEGAEPVAHPAIYLQRVAETPPPFPSLLKAGLEFFVSWKATRVAHFAPLTLFPPF